MLQLLARKIVDVNPIYIIIRSVMIEFEYNKMNYSKSSLFSIGCITKPGQENKFDFIYTIPDDEKNGASRQLIIAKIKELYKHK